MHRGYIKLWRKIEDTELLSNIELMGFAVYLVFKANHFDKKTIFNGQVLDIKRGQLVVGRNSLSEKTGLSSSKIYRYLNTLENIQFLNKSPNNRFTIITICNYGKYQDSETTNEQVTEQQTNNKRTTSEHQANTSKELKRINKNDKNETNTWRTDYSIYLREAKDSINKLVSDAEWMESRETFHPNLDIRLSLKKAFDDYWLTEDGWKRKKQGKSKTIDWKKTASTALTFKGNQVWKQKNY